MASLPGHGRIPVNMVSERDQLRSQFVTELLHNPSIRIKVESALRARAKALIRQVEHMPEPLGIDWVIWEERYGWREESHGAALLDAAENLAAQWAAVTYDPPAWMPWLLVKWQLSDLGNGEFPLVQTAEDWMAQYGRLVWDDHIVPPNRPADRIDEDPTETRDFYGFRLESPHPMAFLQMDLQHWGAFFSAGTRRIDIRYSPKQIDVTEADQTRYADIRDWDAVSKTAHDLLDQALRSLRAEYDDCFPFVVNQGTRAGWKRDASELANAFATDRFPTESAKRKRLQRVAKFIGVDYPTPRTKTRLESA